MSIRVWPEYTPISLEMRDELLPALRELPDGVSEFTFAGLYLFRDTYRYRVAQLPGGGYVVSGEKAGEPFFLLPFEVPDAATLRSLFDTHRYLKNLSARLLAANRDAFEAAGYRVVEDRDNFDYLYARTDLAELSGKQYHKKRNLVNAFVNSYSREERPLDDSNASHALDILEAWRLAKGIDGDYAAARDALEHREALGLEGRVWYVEGASAAFALGERLAGGSMFAIHFEKAVDSFKGIYQYVNQAFASALPAEIVTLNREQDLGEEGLRQAKLTYRPNGFVMKYRVYPS
ncbi:MAG: DUF2156 domain-containing protein [Spirochaetales bacterium]|nr:DUF2156 domain-containing protein [Spirochaetales bacterium]